MLRKRIIFTLIYDRGFFNQSRNFRLQKVGNLKWLEKNYQFQNIAFAIDELIILNASRNEKDLPNFASVVRELVGDVFIPIAAGGGIKTLGDADLLFKHGADKVVLNTILYDDPLLVSKIIDCYGAQSVVASVDYKYTEGRYKVFVNDGARQIEPGLAEYLEYLNALNVGEIYLNSIDKDGTGFGYDFDVIDEIGSKVDTPLIIAGGAGNESHLLAGLKIPQVSAVATANLFNFIGAGLPNARKKIIDEGQNIARWD